MPSSDKIWRLAVLRVDTKFGAYFLAKVLEFSAEFSVSASPSHAEELSIYGPFQYISVGYFSYLHCSLCP